MRVWIRAVMVAGVALVLAGCQTPEDSSRLLDATGQPTEFATAGSDGVRHVPTDTEFPEKLSSLELVGTASNGTDSSVTYRNPKGLVVTYYLYRPEAMGAAPIERGPDSELVTAEFARTAVGFTEMLKRGQFSEFEFISTGTRLDLPAKSQELPAHWAVFKFRSPTQGDRPQIGHLMLTGYRNRFLKIRISYPDPLLDPQAPKGTPEQARDAHMNAVANLIRHNGAILN